jgi:hypothetical protein
MLAVTRVGGLIHLKHWDNEGHRTGYIALHQWNMTERNGEFVMWNPSAEWNINQMFAGVLDVVVKRDSSCQPNWITAVITKRRAVDSPVLSPQLGLYDALLLAEAAGANGTVLPDGMFR